MARNVHIFWESELSQTLEVCRERLKKKVQETDPEYVLNVDEEQYVEYLVSKYRLNPPVLDFDQTWVESREENIPAEQHPSSAFLVERGQSYRRQVVRYHIPYGEDAELLLCKPNPRLMWSQLVRVEGGDISFDLVDFYGDAERIKREASSILGNLGTQLEYMRRNLSDYNNALLAFARKVVAARKDAVQRNVGILHSLGVPVRKSSNIPETFRVPAVRKKIVPRPSAPEKTSLPEPTLGGDVYQEILKVIHDTGKQFERLPSTYAGKDEETLRDHLILVLEPHFEGSTTGETFNKNGKTDILIRHDRSNLFVAECKFWDGPKAHIEAIDQLLSYLTWRDSKSGLVYFVDRKDFSAVLEEVRQTTLEHSCYISFVGAREETWLNYEFHLPGDAGRKVKLAILAFHMPKKLSPR
ncbi:MAG: hypothetical protein HYX89_02015 [Chloroflexi bacterium]|nr:hypothetical protein [Chloroflexota bacterium]